MRFNPRKYQRNNHRSQKIGQQCIRGKTRRTSAQLTGMTAAAVAVGQIRHTIAPSKTSRYISSIGQHTSKAPQSDTPPSETATASHAILSVSNHALLPYRRLAAIGQKSKPESGEPPTRSNKVSPVQTREFSQRRNIRPYRQASPKAMSNSL